MPAHVLVRTSFDMQGFMRFLGAQVEDAGEGSCVIVPPARCELSQQHGFLHAGAIGAIADTAASGAVALAAGIVKCSPWSTS